MTEIAKRARSSVGLLVLAVVTGSIAFSHVFSKHPVAFSMSARMDELIVDAIGMVASILAFGAAVYSYPLRQRIWFRLNLVISILVGCALALELLLGFIWFALDKFVPFGQKH